MIDLKIKRTELLSLFRHSGTAKRLIVEKLRTVHAQRRRELSSLVLTMKYLAVSNDENKDLKSKLYDKNVGAETPRVNNQGYRFAIRSWGYVIGICI